MKLQQMIDNGYADKLTDYPEYRNFERIQIGEYLIFIYHPSKDEYIAQLIQGNDILDSEEYNSHYPAFNKCLEYMKAALDASGYTNLEDCEQHPNSLQYAIEKHTYFESIAPVIYFKNLNSEQYVLGIILKEPNWIEYRDTFPLGKSLGIRLVSKERIKIVPECMEDCKLLSGIPKEGWGYKLRCFNPCPEDIVNAVVKLNIPFMINEYLQHLLKMKSYLNDELSNVVYELDNSSEIENIRVELNKIDNLWKETLV